MRELSLTGDCVFQDGVGELNERAIIANLTSYSAGVRDVRCHKNKIMIFRPTTPETEVGYVQKF